LEKLKEEQLKLSQKIVLKDEFEAVNTIAGVDVVNSDKNIIATVVVCNAKTMEQIERKYSSMEAKFPYITGFQSYRESPPIIDAFSKLRNKPDILIVEGDGALHPRRIGLAAHLGLLLNRPTIGVTKKVSFGELKEDTVYIDLEACGKLVKIKEKGNPVVVSPGHMISLKTSIEIVKKCAREPYKVPMPLALAHKYANKIKKNLEKEDNLVAVGQKESGKEVS